MRVPKDQGLTITIFLSVGLFAVLLFWVFVPPTIDLHGTNENEEQLKLLKPEDAVFQAEQILIQAEKSIAELEKKAEEEKASDKEGKGK